jgi:lysozyme
MNIDNVIETLKVDEGFRPHCYDDPLGYRTIGYGRMVDERLGGGVTEREAEVLLVNDVRAVCRELDGRIRWWRGLPSGVMEAVANMAFQLGVPKLMLFKKTLAALEARDFDRAADEALDSLWARQTPNRAERVAAAIRKGE